MSQRVAGHVRTQRRAVPRPIPRARRLARARRRRARHLAMAHLREAIQVPHHEVELRPLRSEHRSNVPASVVLPLHHHRSVAILHHAHVALRKRVVRQAVFLNLQ